MFSFFEVSSSSKVGVSFTLKASEMVGVYGFTTFTTSVPMLSSFFWEKEIWVKRNTTIINFTCFIFKIVTQRFTEKPRDSQRFFYSVNDEFVLEISPLIMFNSVCASATMSSNSLKFLITLSKIEVALKLSFN